jgi:nicotinamide phosphoribosyltransferase
MKATYGEVDGIGRDIFKDPVTDDGLKKSLKGLLCVHKNSKGELYVIDGCRWREERTGYLKTVYKDGKLTNETSFSKIKELINNKG